MPLLDHFRPPVADEIQWNTFHSAWASALADRLNQVVPAEFRVHENLKLGGGVEVDVATTLPGSPAEPWRSDYQPPEPAGTLPALFPDRFEVLVYRQFGGRQLVAAIELVSPGNKDRDEARSAFASKVVSYLHEGVAVVLIDVVTERRANLHNEVVRLLRVGADFQLPPVPELYAAAYRPVLRDGDPEIDVWSATFAVGEPLPTMPMRLIADHFVAVDFEAAYVDACRRRKLIP